MTSSFVLFASFVVHSRLRDVFQLRWTVPGRLSAFAWPAALVSFFSCKGLGEKPWSCLRSHGLTRTVCRTPSAFGDDVCGACPQGALRDPGLWGRTPSAFGTLDAMMKATALALAGYLGVFLCHTLSAALAHFASPLKTRRAVVYSCDQ